MSIIIDKELQETKRQEIKVISWNLDISNKNTNGKINEIIEKNADIIMLQECNSKIKDKLINYLSYGTSNGHKGLIKLFINKRLNPEIYNIFKDNGLLIYHLNTIYGQMIVASIHLPAFNKINDKILRTISIYKVINFIKTQKLTKLPIIIGGDTNMQDDEHISNISEDILEDLYDNYGDDNNYHTWPIHTHNLQKKNRFDRFFYSNLKIKNFNTWISNYSEHAMLESDIFFPKTVYDHVNTKLEKIKMFNDTTKMCVYV